MAAVATCSDKAANLLQKMSLNSESKTIGVSEPAKKNGPVFSTGPANGMAKPFNPNACFIPNGYPSAAYCYGGYDGEADWNVYSRYANLDGGVCQGVYGDGCSHMYRQGYGYTPYGAYPPPTSSPTIQHDGQLYGLQQYQYPCPFYQTPTSADVSFIPNKISVPQGEISTAVNVDHVPSLGVMNEGNTVSMVNGDCINNNRLKAVLTSSQYSSLNSADSYQRASLPAYVPLSGYHGPRVSTHGPQSVIPSNVSTISDRESKYGAKVGLSSSAVPVKDFTSQRNQRLPQPLPQFMLQNLHGSRHSSGLEGVSGFMNRMYPSNRMYSQYENTFRASFCVGSAAYLSRTGFVDNKLKATSDVCGVDHVKKNMDGFTELKKGPRAAKISDNRGVKSFGPVTLLVKEQNLPTRSDNKEVPLVPNKEHYNGENFSENFSNAKFFVIKSYSEDDVHKSIKYSVWTSTPDGNKKLDAAYKEAKDKLSGCPIFLLFSVNTSGQFVGLAEMVGPVDFDKTVQCWQQDRWTGCFSVKWHVIKDVPNSVLRHITLENNESKPVTNSRDTQEVMFEKGIEIVKIFKGYSSKTCMLDDFGFYEAQEKTSRERKSKEQQFPKQVGKPSDLTFGTVILPQSPDGALMNDSATPDAAEGRVNAEEVLEGNGLTSAFQDSAKSR